MSSATLPTVNQVLDVYETEHVPTLIDGARAKAAIKQLRVGLGSVDIGSIRSKTCREYGLSRKVSDGTVRRELGVLAAAANYYNDEHNALERLPSIRLPKTPPAQQTFLTRSDAALLLAAAMGFYTRSFCDVSTRIEHTAIGRSKHIANKSVARFIIIGLYTGTRHSAILGLRWMEAETGGYVDRDLGIMYRASRSARQSNKRQPAVKIGPRLRAHLKRWRKMDFKARLNLSCYIVHQGDGTPYKRLRGPWYVVRDASGLGDWVKPHVLRHTRATWLLKEGVAVWEASQSLGMSPQILEKVYGHHSPEWQENAAKVG